MNYRFSSELILAMELTNREARRFNQEYVEPGHALLGLLRLDRGNAVDVLRLFGVDLEEVRLELEKSLGTRLHAVPVANPLSRPLIAKLPLAPAMKNVMEYAVEEYRNLNHRCLGTHHVLLGLLREQETATSRWDALGISFDDARTKVSQLSEEEEFRV